jgi:hypothetical protein
VWRWVFYMQVIVFGVVVAIVIIFITETRESLWAPGTLLGFLFMLMLVLSDDQTDAGRTN